MRSVRFIGFFSSVIFLLAFVSPSRAQCPINCRHGEAIHGTNGQVNAAITWDADGAGPENPLWILGGSFSIAGNTAAGNVAVWDTTAWWTLGTGMNGEVQALTIYGDTWVAGGAFTIAD